MINNKKYLIIGGVICTLAGVVGYSLKSQKVKPNSFIEFSLINTSNSLDYRNKPAGIINKGNTCFLNSVLQVNYFINQVALSSQPNFIEYLFELAQHIVLNTEKSLQQQICIELAKIMKYLNSDIEYIDTSDLIDLLSENTEYTFFCQQQDCHELFNMLMKHIEEANNQVNQFDLANIKSQHMKLKNPFLHHTKVQIYCNTCQRSFNSLRIESNYAFLFQLSNAKTIYEAISYIEKPEIISDYICLYCSFALLQNKYQLKAQKEILAKYINQSYFEEDTKQILTKLVEQLNSVPENTVFVNPTLIQAKRTVTKQTKIAKFPKTFCFFVNRLMHDQFGIYKLEDSVVLEKDFKIAQKEYSLSAVICHMGGSQSGHYITLKKTFAQDLEASMSEQKRYKRCEWYFTSDMNVSVAREPSNVPAYLIFYDTI